MASFESKSSDAISLNLTPMMDVFSILITFLLMSFSADPVSYDVHTGVVLPYSLSISGLDEIPTIIVTKTEILINDKVVTPLIGGDVPETDRDQGAIRSVYEELKKLKEVNDRLNKGATAIVSDDVTKLGSITMEMDKFHTFKLIKRIMLSAQQAEFLTFKLMVAKKVY